MIESNFAHNSFVVLSDMLYPGWTATIDNKKQTIYPSNIIGKGIFVGSGYHKIVFQYRPKSYFLGIIFSIFGILIFSFYWFLSIGKIDYLKIKKYTFTK